MCPMFVLVPAINARSGGLCPPEVLVLAVRGVADLLARVAAGEHDSTQPEAASLRTLLVNVLGRADGGLGAVDLAAQPQRRPQRPLPLQLLAHRPPHRVRRRQVRHVAHHEQACHEKTP